MSQTRCHQGHCTSYDVRYYNVTVPYFGEVTQSRPVFHWPLCDEHAADDPDNMELCTDCAEVDRLDALYM